MEREWVVKDGDRVITSFARESDAKAFAKMLTNKNITITRRKVNDGKLKRS